MRPWRTVDQEDVPDDDSTMYLMSRGSEFAIVANDRELMSNRMHGSEDALADFACDRLAQLDDARILVGGLGMGFTLAAVLRRIGPNGEGVVAELIPAVVRWNREYVGRAAGHPLRDPRARVHIGDVTDVIEGSSAHWSAILLDIDNGPAALTRPGNGWLYTKEGLRVAHEALIPGGILGIWSATNNKSFTRRLRGTGFEVEMLQYTEEGRPTPDDSGTHVLWMARRPVD
jgi:spermidine synthase